MIHTSVTDVANRLESSGDTSAPLLPPPPRHVALLLGIGPARGTLWAASHVEVKLAAALRGLATKRVALAVNNAPCDTGRWSCDRLLPRILKPGQTVTVHWPGGKQTYRGKEA